MNVSCQNEYMINPDRPAQGIRDLKRAGFGSLALRLYVPYPDFFDGNRNGKVKPEKEYRSIQERYGLLFSACRGSGIKIPLTYGPSFELNNLSQEGSLIKNFIGNPFRENGASESGSAGVGEAYRKLAVFCVRAVEECLEFCGRNGVKYICIRPVSGNGMHGREWEINRDFYLNLAEKAAEQSVCILLQNMYKKIGGHLVRGLCGEACEAAQWVDRLNAEAGKEVFGFCVDSGICSLCGNDMHEFMTLLGSRVKAVVLRDCDGRSDTAMLPFTCVGESGVRTDWMGLIRGLRDIGFDGELTVEFSGTTAAFSPLLRPTLFQMAREVGEFFRWQVRMEQNLKKYRSIVLFGAGNMCRNYMKCYGEKYPPLFTCDNNPELWDKEFEGLIVKNPEELKKLPENCGVYICNVYYQEIELQLREMGIVNIEYFNDEYMPTFYFDRLKRI